MPSTRFPHLPTIRSKLITLVLASVLPILFGAIALVRDAGLREEEHVARDATTITRALVAAVDRELDSAESAARVAAAWPTLEAHTLGQFHASARALLRPEFPGHALVLLGADGQPLLDTHHPFGAAPPPAGHADSVAAVLAGGNARISGLYRASPDSPWVVSADVPVWRAGKVAYVLSVQMRPKRVAELLGSQQLPPGWVAEVYDGDGRLVARNREQAQYVGTRIAAPLAAALARSPEGVLADSNPQFDKPWHTAWSRSNAHGWTVALNYPDDAARTLLGGTLPATVAASAALLGLGLLLAWVIGGTIARSVSGLNAPAAALGRGEPLALPQPTIRETAAVAEALRQVEGELAKYRGRLESLVDERTAELARLNARVATVYATAPVGLCFLDRDLRFVMINDYLADINAIPAAEHIGRTLPELLGATGIAFEEPYRRVLASGRPLRDSETYGDVPARPGVMRSWLTSYYPVYGPDNELVGINAVVIDITERKLLEQQNRDNEEMFRVLFEASGDAQALLAQNGDFISANPAAVALFGYAEADDLLALSPAHVSPALQPDGRASSEVLEAYFRRARAEGGVQFEWVHQRCDGSNFHADVKLTSLRIGEVGMMQATIRDISARVAADAALRAGDAQLRQRERFIRTVTDNLPALVSYWDADERLRFANRPLLEWFGRDEDQVIGRRLDELVPESVLRPFAPFVEGVLAGKPQRFERELRGPDGQPVHIWGNYLPDLDRAGRVRGSYKLHLDITDLKRTEGKLVHALRAAEAASRAKSEFLGNMSHEIRTPMNAIVGLARLLEEAPLGPRERGHVAHIQAASKSLLGLLNDLLDYSRVDAGQLVLEQVPLRLDSTLQNIAILTAPGAWAKGVEPVIAVAPNVPDGLIGDPLRLEQVLLNLVGNAVKFTERGEVVLAVHLVARAEHSVRLRFAVRDTGIGIAQAEQERMFEPFTQGDSSTRRKHGGAGLGLSIARRLVAMMGGELGVESQPGAGSVFRFEVDLGRGGRGAAGTIAAPPAPRRVLLLEPNASAGTALASALAGQGWQVAYAADSGAARALLEGGPPFDYLFAPAPPAGLGERDLPPLVLVAPDPESARQDALAAGMAPLAQLAKPFTPGSLRALLAQLDGQLPAPGNDTAPVAARLAGLRVLVVEDNPVNQEVARHILQHAGASASFADNGRVALALLDGPDARFDAVLMDLQMPVMNGFEATAAIRARGLRELPIVAMTANAMDEDRRAALASGMDAHLAKPIDVDELVATLARVTGRDAHPAQPLPPAAAARDPQRQAALPTLPGVDLQDALPRFGGDFAAFAAVFRRFALAQDGTVAELSAHLATGARDSAAQCAHRLRGVAANLGAHEVALLAQALEHGLPDTPMHALEPQLAALEAALETLALAARTLQGPAVPDNAGADSPGRDSPGRDSPGRDSPGRDSPGRDSPGPEAPTAAAPDAAALLRLLEQLESNNLGAGATCAALRPGLQAAFGAAEADALAEAVATLRFERAAALVRAILARKGDA